MGFQNSAVGSDLGFYAARSYSLTRPPRTGAALDPLPGEVRNRMIGPRRAELTAAIRVPPVVMGRVLGQDRPQMPFAEDQHPVSDLRPGGEHVGELYPRPGILQVHEQVPGLLDHPCLGWVLGGSEDAYPAGAVFYNGKDVDLRSVEQVTGEEVQR